MRALKAIVGALVLLAIAAFCLFGFAASFEGRSGLFLAFRIGYAVIGLGCLAGVVVLIKTYFGRTNGSDR